MCHRAYFQNNHKNIHVCYKQFLQKMIKNQDKIQWQYFDLSWLSIAGKE